MPVINYGCASCYTTNKLAGDCKQTYLGKYPFIASNLPSPNHTFMLPRTFPAAYTTIKRIRNEINIYAACTYHLLILHAEVGSKHRSISLRYNINCAPPGPSPLQLYKSTHRYHPTLNIIGSVYHFGIHASHKKLYQIQNFCKF